MASVALHSGRAEARGEEAEDKSVLKVGAGKVVWTTFSTDLSVHPIEGKRWFY